MRRIYSFIICVILGVGVIWGEELPIPSYQNSVIVSIELPNLETAEVDYIKNNFNFGLYTWLSLSWTSAKPVLDWHTAWDQADTGIQSFKNSVNNFIQKAKDKNVKCHLVLGAGLNRGVFIYREAKEEDIRSCQWYNDNRIASDSQILDPNAMDNTIWSTLSRYARKKRHNLEAKARAALAFLKQRMDDEPDVLYLLSGWAETELNVNRIDHGTSVQDYFCDYSPFAVLEFQDWIAHTGMYDDSAGAYADEGYTLGGAKYQGASGLTQFNSDFGTDFSSWDLKYYSWGLDDDYDIDPTDPVNQDPHRIPINNYSHGNMMPTSGPDFIAGGFDPPRKMQPGDKFWDLWNLFRETMVHNCARDLARWASEAGIPAERWFSHQIPGDYLFGTNPDVVNKNARYYTSASPMWTADILPFGSPGATLYDIKFPINIHPGEFVRSTQYGLSAISAMAANWAIMEYDAETYPVGMSVAQSTPEIIFDQYMHVYNHNAHVINFWRWQDGTKEHQIKGMNKEEALRRFIHKIRDKARKTDLSAVFDPPRVIDFSGEQNKETAENKLRVSGKIWSGHPWKWRDWGDFADFEIFRGETPDYTLDAKHSLGKTNTYSFVDSSAQKNITYYYRIRAVNSMGKPGPASLTIKLPRDDVFILDLKAGEGGTTDPEPGLYGLDSGVEVEITAVPDAGHFFLTWTGDESGSENALTVLMDSAKTITAHFSETNLYPPLNFLGQKVANTSLVQVEYINYLTWESNPQNQNVNTYRIYEFIGETHQLLAELGPTVFQYALRRVERDREYTYGISVVDSMGHEGPPATIKVI
ncbi:hypothetical protein ACFLR7_05130 [Acidobacteriota bacterium]